MKRSWTAVLAVLLGVFGVAGCLSGQTGSASSCPPTPVTCVCDNLTGFHVAKGTVTAVDGNIVSVHVDQVLDDAPGGMTVLEQTIDGTCPISRCDTLPPALPAVGTEVFATFNSRPDTVRGNLLCVQPWGDGVRLAGGTVVPIADAVEFAETNACYERYNPPRDDCDDSADRNHGCSVAPASTSSSRTPTGALMALLSACALLRRRARQ